MRSWVKWGEKPGQTDWTSANGSCTHHCTYNSPKRGAWAGACDVGPKPGESQIASLALRCLAGDGLALEVDRAETGYRWGTGWTSWRLWSIATLSVFYVKTLL